MHILRVKKYYILHMQTTITIWFFICGGIKRRWQETWILRSLYYAVAHSTFEYTWKRNRWKVWKPLYIISKRNKPGNVMLLSDNSNCSTLRRLVLERYALWCGKCAPHAPCASQREAHLMRTNIANVNFIGVIATSNFKVWSYQPPPFVLDFHGVQQAPS